MFCREGPRTRLRSITHTSAKQLLPVANKPVLFYGLEAIRDAGITDFGGIVGDTAEGIQAAAGHGSAFGPRVSYIRQKAPLGLAHAVLTARVHLGDDDFVMYVGEKSIGGGITSLVEEFRSERPDAQIMLTQVPNPVSSKWPNWVPSGRSLDWKRSRSGPKAISPWSRLHLHLLGPPDGPHP